MAYTLLLAYPISGDETVFLFMVPWDDCGGEALSLVRRDFFLCRVACLSIGLVWCSVAVFEGFGLWGVCIDCGFD